jgi:hypothetical protein
MNRYGVLLLSLGLLLQVGCSSTVRTTDPTRTATELFLQSEAVTKAVSQLNVTPLRDRAAFVDASYLSASDKEFLLGEVRAHLLTQGVKLVNSRTDAQVIVEVRSGGVGVDRSGTLIGLPPMVMPTGAGAGSSNATVFVAQYATPELSLYKDINQVGYASVAFVAYWASNGEVLASSGPFIGKRYRTDWWMIGLGHNVRGNVVTAQEPPKKKSRDDRDQ